MIVRRRAWRLGRKEKERKEIKVVVVVVSVYALVRPFDLIYSISFTALSIYFVILDFSALFGKKSNKPNKILAPQAQQAQVLDTEPAPAPQMQMVQPRRRPPSLVL